MKITSISQQKKNLERVNIFVDNKYLCSIDKNSMIELGIFKGMEINESFQDDLIAASDFSKLVERVTNFLFLRPRSRYELNFFLEYKLQLDEIETQKIIDKLIQRHIIAEDKNIDDERFATWFVEQRKLGGKYGENKIRQDLMRKGISNTLIKNILSSEIDKDYEIEKINVLFEKFNNQIKEPDKFKKKNKIIQRLLSRGFSYDDIKKIVK